jgi:hypothetical protein
MEAAAGCSQGMNFPEFEQLGAANQGLDVAVRCSDVTGLNADANHVGRYCYPSGTWQESGSAVDFSFT